MEDYKKSAFLEIETQEIDIQKRETEDGTIYLKSAVTVKSHPYRLTSKLAFWAAKYPERIFLGEKDETENWRTITYAETYRKVRNIAQWLLNLSVNQEQPLAIVCENCIENGLMALAAMHIGVPYSPITPAYATKSSDLSKFKHVLDTLTPSVVLISDGTLFQNALTLLNDQQTVVYLKNSPTNQNSISFEEICKTNPTEAVEQAHENILPDSIAKILFTSGSTGLPKGVINTHNNISTNWQQIEQVFPIMKDGFTLIDWLPWNHTFGSNHNFGLTLNNGGTLYIDNGNPTPSGIQKTVKNLREIKPTIYFNVPKGFEELLPYLKEDEELRKGFFENLKFMFYAGAGMPQHVWDALELLAFNTLGKRILISTGLGCTEASPSALFNTHFGSFAGMLGVPVHGLELKLLPNGGKLEVRFKADNIMPGYWRNEEATRKAFDDEGFYITGDALKFVNPEEPNEGMIFDGRIAEDFKLDTGTWVSVGTMRSKLIEAGNGLIQDVVITGHDRAYLGAIVFLEPGFMKENFNINHETMEEVSKNISIQAYLKNVLTTLAKTSKGSSTLIKKAIIAPFLLSFEKGEITDKGSINQRAVLTNRAEIVELIYAKTPSNQIVESI